MGYSHTTISAAPTAVADGYVASVDMANGDYTLAATTPGYGARHITMTRTVVNNPDSPGTVTFTGKDLSGQVISEVLIPGAHSVLVTGTKFFASVSKSIQAGWILGAAAADTIVIGWDAQNAVATSGGVFHGIVVNTTAGGTITVSDSAGTIAVLPTNVAVGFYGPYDANVNGYLRVETAAASNITVLHTGSMPSTYAM